MNISDDGFNIIKKFEGFDLQKDFSLFAIGGYGNREIFPSSDIDISILQINSKVKSYSNLEKFVASLWDFGLKVGHSVRTKQEIKKIITSDVKEFTSYLSWIYSFYKCGVVVYYL